MVPIQLESHTTNILILTGGSSFVNASRTPAGTRGGAQHAAVSRRPDHAFQGDLRSKAASTLISFSLFVLPLEPTAAVLLMLSTRIFNPECYTPPEKP